MLFQPSVSFLFVFFFLSFSPRLWQNRHPWRSFAAEGDGSTPPNPPLVALLTQSIPHGGEPSVAKPWFAKLRLPGQRELQFVYLFIYLFAVMPAQVCGGSGLDLQQDRPLLGHNELDSAVMTTTLCVCERRTASCRLTISSECVCEAVSGLVLDFHTICHQNTFKFAAVNFTSLTCASSLCVWCVSRHGTVEYKVYSTHVDCSR